MRAMLLMWVIFFTASVMMVLPICPRPLLRLET